MSSETPTERREAAATRRRWVTLAEVLAVAGVLIAALTLWSNWSERSADNAEKASARASEARKDQRFEIRAVAAENGESLMLLRDEKHEIVDATVAFPTALGVARQDALTDQIQRSWFEKALLKATDGGADDQAGRLPVFITVRYTDGDATRSASGIYDVIWQTKAGGILSGRSLTLQGLRVRQRGADQARLDAIWAKEKPAA
ncbi:hypothetical protein EQZ23_01855 [Sphingomonas sp. UV9]|uniref:hypothetical protein n=1 Tax=Sphingomonas sp. UV9 TaxID=1851410 RepID=UPI000FFC88E6|nr:hypothetical protein [Sphingomonas sp. UV9]RXD06866.1 hypothetical protein EQZ23_01855 [Sphingomonas sp. UV9]